MTGRLIALAILDLVLLAVGASGLCPVAAAMLGHAVFSAAALRGWLRAGRGTAPVVAAMAGPGALALAHWLSRWPALRAMPPERREDAPAAVAKASLALRMLDGRVHHAAPDALGSLVTVLRHGTVHDRRRALESVVRSFRPALSPLLAIALTDRDQTIRALAAAAAARVAQNLAGVRAGAAATEYVGPRAALLIDHARANVLLSDSQRGHLRDDALAMLAGTAGGGVRDLLRVETRWATGDYAELDTLVAGIALEDAVGAAAAVDWWRRGAA